VIGDKTDNEREATLGSYDWKIGADERRFAVNNEPQRSTFQQHLKLLKLATKEIAVLTPEEPEATSSDI
jgi:hypothetical protein